DSLTRVLGIIAWTAVAFIVVVGLFRDMPIEDVLLLGTAMAISAIPTGLPTFVQAMLSYGAKQLAEAKAVVKNLTDVETLGATSAINTDKTGTLTMNQMMVSTIYSAGSWFTVDGEGYRKSGAIRSVAGKPVPDFTRLAYGLVLDSDATVSDDGAVVGDPTEAALVVLAAKLGVDADQTRRAYPRLAEVPFDSEYKFMATFHEMEDRGRQVVRCFVKGAPDVLLARSTHYLDEDGSSLPPLGDEAHDRVLAENDRMAGEGHRVLAVARRHFDPASFDRRGDLLALISDLELLALVGIVDPPRKEAKDAISLCKDAGIRVRMITGDHATTAGAIAGQLGIEGRALTGAEFAALGDDELHAQVGDIGVVARVAPEDKVRLVSILKEQGNIVAMTGDGVNDAPALARADIGVAMGITGTEVTKDAAEMILTDDNFATIVTAVEGGRGLYDNLMKYIRVQMIMLAGFILTFVGAGIFTIADGTPLLPLQILWINFAVDVLLAVGLGFDAPTPGLMQRRPRSPDEPVIARDLGVRLGVAGLLIAIGTLAVVSWGEDRYGLAVATTMGLVTTSLLHVAAALEWRDPRESVFRRETVANGRFNLLMLAAIALTLLVTTVPLLQRIFDTADLGGHQWRACLVAVAAYVALTEVGKFVLRRLDREGA
ncbi:MAG: cation-translocating P-type ATPase, partial [Acidimicrobiales bacterium]